MKIEVCLVLVAALATAPRVLAQPRPVPDVPPALEPYLENDLSVRDGIGSGRGIGYPPRLADRTPEEDVRLDYVPSRVRPAADLRAEARAAALADPRVAAMLGDRFAVIGGGLDEPGKRSDRIEGDRLWVDFYSYSANRAVRVIVQRGAVVAIEPRPDFYQPPETRDEVADAAAIVRRDPRYRSMVANLRARGIATPSGGRNRHLFLQFYRGRTRPAVFTARVDMSAGRVVEAGLVRRR